MTREYVYEFKVLKKRTCAYMTQPPVMESDVDDGWIGLGSVRFPLVRCGWWSNHAGFPQTVTGTIDYHYGFTHAAATVTGARGLRDAPRVGRPPGAPGRRAHA